MIDYQKRYDRQQVFALGNSHFGLAEFGVGIAIGIKIDENQWEFDADPDFDFDPDDAHLP